MGRSYSNHLSLSSPDAGECNWDVDWYRNQNIKDLMTWQLMKRDHVVSGGVLSYVSGTTINFSEVVANINETEYTVNAGSVSLAPAAVGETILNYIYINDSGAIISTTTAPTVSRYAMIGLVDSDENAEWVRQADLRADPYQHPDKTPVENHVINGTFDIWDYGTSQTGNGIDSDNRFHNSNSGTTKTHTQQAHTVGQTDVPGNPMFYSRTVVTSISGSGNYCRKFTRLLDVTRYAGKTIGIKAYGKGSAVLEIAVVLEQNFGTGGSTKVDNYVGRFNLTTSWSKQILFITLPSITGKTLGTNHFGQLSFWFDAGTSFDAVTDSLGHQSGTFELSEIEVFDASEGVELPVRRPTKMETRNLCDKYFFKSGSLQVKGYLPASYQWRQPYEISRMIQAPTITVTPETSNNIGDVSAFSSDENYIHFQATKDGSTGAYTSRWNYEASAEL